MLCKYYSTYYHNALYLVGTQHLIFLIEGIVELAERLDSVQFSRSVVSDPMDCSVPGFPVLQLPELAQTHVCQVGDAVQPSHPLSILLLLPVLCHDLGPGGL